MAAYHELLKLDARGLLVWKPRKGHNKYDGLFNSRYAHQLAGNASMATVKIDGVAHDYAEIVNHLRNRL